MTALPPDVRARLTDLAARYPAGTRVRHEAGWTARVVADDSGEHPGVALSAAPAHVVAGIVGAVHLAPEGRLPDCWMNVRSLTRISADIPAADAPPSAEPPASRTRKRTR